MDYKVIKGYFIVLSIMMVASSAAASTGFDVSIASSETTVDPVDGDSAAFDIQVTNHGEERRTFWVTYNTGTASSPSWYGLSENALVLDVNETGLSTLSVTPDPTAVSGNFGPEIVVYPLDDPSNKFSKFATFSVVRDDRLYIADFTGMRPSYDPGERLSVEVDVKNVVQQDIAANQFQLVLSVGEREETVSLPALEPGEMESVDVGMRLDEMRAGVYDMSLEVTDVEGRMHSRSTAKVRVNAIESSQSTLRSVDKGVLRSRTISSIENTGNTVLTDVEVSSQSAWYVSPFVSFEKEPDAVLENKANDVYVWRVDELEPNERVSYSYTVNYWPVPIVFVVIFAIIGVIIGQYRRVTVVKRIKREGDRFTVHLRVKNRTGREIDDVGVEDFVPGIAMLVRKFDSRTPDRIRNTEEGTEVIWEFGRMESGEERIVTYTLRPKIRVEGNVSLPEAIVEYTRGDKQYSATSHPVSADFRE